MNVEMKTFAALYVKSWLGRVLLQFVELLGGEYNFENCDLYD